MKIVLYPHPALRYPARPLTTIDKQVQMNVRAMFDLLYEQRGLGLAGNQVAWPYQIFIANLTTDPQQTEHEEVYINPVVLERKGSQEGEEGCLSFPKLYQNVRRAKTVKVRAYNLKGETIEVIASDLSARVLQHEIDHLSGVLFIDKMGPIAKWDSRGKLREFEENYRRAQEKGESPPDAEIIKTLDAAAPVIL